MPTPADTSATTPHDATAEFQSALDDPSRWVIRRGVPIFKAHQRTDPATGALIKVDVPKLYRIAANMQRLERGEGVPIRMTLGHTEPGKPETEQPPVGGYYRNARVQPFGPKNEPAVVVDEWLDPQYAPVRKNFPYRSAEYYDDAEQITGVALLTRDPFLDLGVVAYSRDSGLASYTKESTKPVHYSKDGRRPVLYQLVIGEKSMPDPVNVPTGTPPAPPAGVTPPQTPTPTPYTGTWPGPAHRPPSMHRQHNQSGAVYANAPARPRRAQYANEPGMPPDMPGGPGGPGGGGNPFEALYEGLMQAVEAVTELMGDGGGMPPGGPGGPGAGPPQTPFPEEEPEQLGRYANTPSRPARRYPARGRYNYQRQGAVVNPYYYSQNPPVPAAPAPAAGARTISGLPVGYQMKLDQLQYQNQQLNEALKLLYYERDQADTEACAAEIGKLAAMGYAVGEYEVAELKAKPRDQRAAYLQHIATKYQRVGTESPPPILGDPTPGQAPTHGGPLTEAEMTAALKMTANDPDPNAFTRAVNYIRAGGAGQTPYGPGPHNRLPAGYDPAAHAWGEGQQAPAFDPNNPYGEPSYNGDGY